MNVRVSPNLILAAGLPIMAAVFLVAVSVGRYQISFDALVSILSGDHSEYITEWNVLTKLRIPRTIAAACVGVALSISGLLFQELFQNKLVSPDFLGVSEGAGVGAALAILLGMSVTMVSIMAFAAGLLAVTATITLSKCFRTKSPLGLLMSGIVVGGMAAAFLQIIKCQAGPEATLAAIEFWLMGSCESVTPVEAFMLIGVVSVLATIILSVKWRINMVSLGYEECRSRGVDYRKYHWLIILVATFLTASTVAVVGCVSWIGLVVPHIARMVVGQNTKYSIPMAIVLGGTSVMIADVLSRSFSTAEYPLSAVTALFGTVVILALIIAKRGKLDDRI